MMEKLREVHFDCIANYKSFKNVFLEEWYKLEDGDELTVYSDPHTETFVFHIENEFGQAIFTLDRKETAEQTFEQFHRKYYESCYYAYTEKPEYHLNDQEIKERQNWF